MLNPKRFSPAGNVPLKTERDALLETKGIFSKMLIDIDKQLKEQLIALAETNQSHIEPSSFPDVYFDPQFRSTIDEIRDWFTNNSITPTVLPLDSKIVSTMETRHKEKKRIEEELNRVISTINDYDNAPDDNSRKQIIEDYYKKSHQNEINRSNEHQLFGVRGMGYNHNVKKMEQNDRKMDEHIAKKTVNPNNTVANAAHDANLHFRANYQAVLKGRKIRSDAEQKVVLLSHALKVQKYEKKAAKLETKRDLLRHQGNTKKADEVQKDINELQEKIDKPISVWSANWIILKESAKDLFRTKRKFQDYRPWEVRRAEELEKKVERKL